MDRFELRAIYTQRREIIAFADAAVSDLEQLAKGFPTVPIEVDGDALAILRRAVNS